VPEFRYGEAFGRGTVYSLLNACAGNAVDLHADAEHPAQFVAVD
jgi:hypothetical protein